MAISYYSNKIKSEDVPEAKYDEYSRWVEMYFNPVRDLTTARRHSTHCNWSIVSVSDFPPVAPKLLNNVPRPSLCRNSSIHFLWRRKTNRNRLIYLLVYGKAMRWTLLLSILQWRILIDKTENFTRYYLIYLMYLYIQRTEAQ